MKYVSVFKNRHGKTVTYFRRTHYPVIRLPNDVGSPEFMAAYEAALAEEALPNVLGMPVSPIIARKQRVEKALNQCLRSARNRKNRRHMEFDLTIDWLLDEVEKQNFCCALTGIEFFAAHRSNGAKNPYTPSIDRIDPKRGYTRDNVRIVCFAINTMLMDWGPAIFEQIARSYRVAKNKKRGFYCPTFEKDVTLSKKAG
jgi:hypothetical protein